VREPERYRKYRTPSFQRLPQVQGNELNVVRRVIRAELMRHSFDRLNERRQNRLDQLHFSTSKTSTICFPDVLESWLPALTHSARRT
jgi:hypothetical protein